MLMYTQTHISGNWQLSTPMLHVYLRDKPSDRVSEALQVQVI